MSGQLPVVARVAVEEYSHPGTNLNHLYCQKEHSLAPKAVVVGTTVSQHLAKEAPARSQVVQLVPPLVPHSDLPMGRTRGFDLRMDLEQSAQ